MPGATLGIFTAGKTPEETHVIRIVVDLNRCQAYGQCCFAAPSVFSLQGESLVYDTSPSDDVRKDVERAMHACPVQAISVEFDAEVEEWKAEEQRPVE